MPKLNLTDVTMVYGYGDAAVRALDDVSLAVEACELVAVVGPSGSGKTTLLAIAGALLHPTSGRVVLDDLEITRLDPRALGRVRLEHVGFVLQTANLIPYVTARDQLLLVAKLAGKLNAAARRQADDLLAHLGIGDRAGHYPEALSGGERQRVAIARALMNNADVILADEPTANLDSERGRDVVDMLAREAHERRKAIVMVTHDERMLDRCDRVVRISDGRLTDVAKPAGVGTRNVA